MSREGWKWVEVYAEFPYNYVHAFRRIYPRAVPLSAEEQARLEELTGRHDALAAEHGEDPPDEVAAELDSLADEIVVIQRRAEAYLTEDLARAGAIVSLSSEGTLRVERGFVKPEDEWRQEDAGSSPGAKEPGPRTSPGSAENSVGEAEAEKVRPLPAQLIENLTAHRTMALQECLAASPDVAFIAVTHALALRTFYRDGYDLDTCVGIEPRTPALIRAAPGVAESRAGQAMARRHEDWARRLPQESADLWGWIVAQDAESRVALLAYCAARAVDAIYQSVGQRSRELRHADQLALAVGLDMADWWAPTRESYLAHLPKARIVEAVRNGVSERDADDLEGLKKEAMIEHAERLLAGSRWLPEVLRNDLCAVSGSAPSA